MTAETKDFLLEIGIEEMPAKFAPGAVTQLKNNSSKLLAEKRLSYEEIEVFVTPRRLALYVKRLAVQQDDINEEVKGPAQKAAYDSDGNPTKAAQGFARGQGVSAEDLFIKEFNGTPYVFAVKYQKGEETEKLLPQLCLDIIHSLNFPKPMRWGEYEVRFARPIRWLLALYEEQVVPFSFVGLQSGRTTRGHRTLGGYVRLMKPQEYELAMQASFVIVDQNKRKKNIWNQIEKLASQVGGKVDEDDDLLSEITHLVEFPTALLGEVDAVYMTMPEEVITTPMKEHQKYFPVRGQDGKLLPYFITVRNGDSTGLNIVKEGNKKVLKARLEDAAFYYREDLKKPLASLVPELDKVVYHEKLGTVGQRIKRLRDLSAKIADKMNLTQEQKQLVDRTAFLAKADLVTHMVYDFPELQGIMGYYYAGMNGEDKEVCKGIQEHYKPKSSGDSLPESITGRVVSIADKLDAIVGSFGIGIQPTGSQDPYALRRQALGIVAMLMEDKQNISLSELLQDAYTCLTDQEIKLESLTDILPALKDFFAQRIRYQLQEEGIKYDTIDAVMAQGISYPRSTALKAGVLSAKRETEGFTAYVNAYTRCVNLSKKQENENWNPDNLADQSEKDLFRELELKKPEIREAVEKGDYETAFNTAAELVLLIENLFDSVMIMAEDEDLKNARLGLLKDCVDNLGCLGDLTQLAQ